ncbi:PLP-dependent aminotransferase family protein [Bacillus sp. JJ1532]|uniref:MocR-like pyridoxine biosynthesis transcription factor PdxR n=1 Tax=unclassified Bacillus (in: firmicutes) TaxID=185979 RepID=UPI003000C11A
MENFIFALEDHSSKYKQIYERFKLLIEHGDLPANEQLPSIRQLADSLQVSRNTTLMAYDQLVAEGYIRGEGRKGYFVNVLEPPLFQEEVIPIPSKQTEPVTTFFVDFKAGAVDQTNFPLKAWRRISNSVLTLQESFQYGDPFGEMCLRKQIAAYLLQSRGVKTDPNAIIIGSSTQQMLINLGQILKDDFQSMIVEDPGYDGAKEAFLFHRFTLETLPVDETGADFSQLEKMMSRLIYVTPSHQSPIGVSMSIQQRQKLIHWANKKKGYIIEDDYDSEFRYTQQPFPALTSIDSKRVIYLGNFSKSFLPGIRLSYMVLPPILLDRYIKQFQHFESTTSLTSQLTMAKFMEEGEWNRHIKRMRLVYKRKMQCIVSELKKQFKQHISIIGEQSGLYLLVKIHQTHSEDWLIERAAFYGVKVYPTSIYFINNRSDEAIIKLGFSNLTCEEIQLGVKFLKKAWL